MVGEIKIKDVHKSFPNTEPGKEDIVALNGINLEIKPGSFVSLIGPSGCGKSTLLRIIGGLDRASEGEIYLDDKEIKKPGSDRGFAFQGSNLFPWLTVENNIAFGLKARHIYKKDKEEVQNFVKLVGLEGFEKSYPHQLSGGMQQRASLARALVGHPAVLLLDEPLGALDAFTRMNLQDEILNIWKKNNMTMIMVTHDVDEAIYMSDQVVVMSARPSKVEAIIDIDLPRPRARAQDTFQEYRAKILKELDLGGKVEEVEYYL
ncbi:sulfonate transport system ATP-binding protein [Eubacterium ruminantium]|uniref:Sulfonate transport system ATP-binding protein n=1 Tax=Eubacterium ruminantium TaxID=42322 RepID=A0A1T4KHG2_9FIRM|nr:MULTISPECIES: ABC transporter ATP-binding protein [Eubacterium]MCR5368680.1 ABC transporter ATP-binding protein [Eubacterium sp.]SCW32080.1 sulfonate transport system ATP-binding protein [Eubacterium ruminantium]SDM27171.1 sulfonate transport system ATP-binding protein [Eubacterium ruminantium]SJZ41841.1 sulfonate transport system ATP-binding protein [Eubacterium ruminantium]